jgi:hypothetical protein
MAAQFTSTRAVLADDEHATVGRGRHGDLLAQRAHHVALAHHHEPPVDVLAQRAVLGLELALPQRVAYDVQCLVDR